MAAKYEPYFNEVTACIKAGMSWPSIAAHLNQAHPEAMGEAGASRQGLQDWFERRRNRQIRINRKLGPFKREEKGEPLLTLPTESPKPGPRVVPQRPQNLPPSLEEDDLTQPSTKVSPFVVLGQKQLRKDS
jgi:hypothetical protein